MFSFFKKPKSSLSEDLKRQGLRNEARFKAQKELMQAEGKHLLQQSFKWIPADKWAEMHGL